MDKIHHLNSVDDAAAALVGSVVDRRRRSLQPLGNGSTIVTGNRPVVKSVDISRRRTRCRVRRVSEMFESVELSIN